MTDDHDPRAPHGVEQRDQVSDVSGPAVRARQVCASTCVGAVDGATVLNDVMFTQVCATFGTGQRTEEVVRRLDAVRKAIIGL